MSDADAWCSALLERYEYEADVHTDRLPYRAASRETTISAAVEARQLSTRCRAASLFLTCDNISARSGGRPPGAGAVINDSRAPQPALMGPRLLPD